MWMVVVVVVVVVMVVMLLLLLMMMMKIIPSRRLYLFKGWSDIVSVWRLSWKVVTKDILKRPLVGHYYSSLFFPIIQIV
jgi:hypothetical protein